MRNCRFFSHDEDARNDPKCIKLRRTGGLAAYGLFWCVIEMLRKEENNELPLTAIGDICFDLRADESLFEALFDSGLIEKNETVFFSRSLKGRMDSMKKIAEKRSNAGLKGAKARLGVEGNQANAKQMLTDDEAIAKQMLTDDEAIASVCQATKLKLKETKLKETYLKRNNKEKEVFDIPEKLKSDPKFLEAWENWILHLKEKKSKPTPSALKKQLEFCASIGAGEAIKSIERSIMNSYQGLFPVNQNQGNARQNSNKGQEFDAFDSLNRLFPPEEGQKS